MINLFALPQFGFTHVVVWFKAASHFLEPDVSQQRDAISTNIDLGRTHKAVCRFYMHEHNATRALVDISVWMEAEHFSPNGMAEQYLSNLGVKHSSMSVGDVVQFGELYFLLENNEWKDITASIKTSSPVLPETQ